MLYPCTRETHILTKLKITATSTSSSISISLSKCKRRKHQMTRTLKASLYPNIALRCPHINEQQLSYSDWTDLVHFCSHYQLSEHAATNYLEERLQDVQTVTHFPVQFITAYQGVQCSQLHGDIKQKLCRWHHKSIFYYLLDPVQLQLVQLLGNMTPK